MPDFLSDLTYCVSYLYLVLKKPYHTPTVTELGTVEEVTEHVVSGPMPTGPERPTGMPDGT